MNHQIARQARFHIIVLAVAFSASACAQTSLPPSSTPTIKLQGIYGEPLPPPNKAVAHHWPPEIKQLVDDMLELFDNKRTPTLRVEQIEQKLKIKLNRTPLRSDQGGMTANYDIVQSAWLISRTDQPDPRLPGNYVIRDDVKTKLTSHKLELPLDMTRYCLSPYDLAIYTGAQYSPDPIWFPRSKFIQPGPPRYEWGMFNPQPNGQSFFRAQSLFAPRTAVLSVRASPSCVGTLAGYTVTPLEK